MKDVGTGSSSWPRPFVARSQLRLVRVRDRSVLSRIPLGVFGADHFGPWAQIGPISDGRRPGRGEDAVILDRKAELQHLAPVVGIDLHGTRRGSRSDIGVFFGVALQGVFGGVVID